MFGKASRTLGWVVGAVLTAHGAAAAPADVAPLPAPVGKVVLRVSGDIAVRNYLNRAEFDLDMLRAMPVETIRTTTVWTKGQLELTGVPLAALMQRLGVEEGTLIAHATDEVVVRIPVSDAVAGGPIVAYLENGAPLPAGRGPLWVVYPYDGNATYRTEETYLRSTWQLDWIDVQR